MYAAPVVDVDLTPEEPSQAVADALNAAMTEEVVAMMRDGRIFFEIMDRSARGLPLTPGRGEAPGTAD